MSNRTQTPLLMLVSFATVLSCAIEAAAQAVQPPAEGAAAAPAAATTADDPMRALLARPEAVTVATIRCTSATTGGCPVTEASHTALKEHFNGTLRTGTASDTPLATAIKGLLSAAGDGVWPADVSHALVHLVWRAAEGQPLRDRWIMAARDGSNVTLSFDRRLFGVKKLAFVFVHLDVEAGGFDAEYRAIVDKKRAVNVEHLLALLKLATMRGAQAAAAPVAVFGAGLLEGIATPSDITAFCVRTAGELGVLGQSIVLDNEGKHWWDATVAVPVNKITLLDYSEEDGAFIPKKVNKQSIYGTLNLYLKPVDLKAGNARWLVPRAILGLGLTGRPGENFLIGASFGIPQVQFFIGSAFANHRTLIPGKDPADGASYTQRYGSRLAYGVNIPVLLAIRQLTP